MADVAGVIVTGSGHIVGVVGTAASHVATVGILSNPNEATRVIMLTDGDAFAGIAADGSDSTKTEAQRIAAIAAGIAADGGLPVLAKPSYLFTGAALQNGDLVAPDDGSVYGPASPLNSIRS